MATFFKLLFDSTTVAVNKTLIALAANSITCVEHGLYVNKANLPVKDSTVTLAASLKKQGENRNTYQYNDEWVTKHRSMTNGSGGGGAEAGAQHQLTSYNRPPEDTNELKSEINVSRFPRKSANCNIQPAMFGEHLAQDTPLFELGYTSRHLISFLRPNFDKTGAR